LTADKKKIPKQPEPYVMYDEEDDNIFFAASVEAGGYDAAVEIALVVDVKNEDNEDSMEYLYSIFLDPEELTGLLKWVKKAIKYIGHVEEHGTPIPLILGVEDEDGNLESI
jgi:hypothetical protein